VIALAALSCAVDDPRARHRESTPKAASKDAATADGSGEQLGFLGYTIGIIDTGATTTTGAPAGIPVEQHRDIVIGYYQQYLHRTPTDAEIAPLLAVMAQNTVFAQTIAHDAIAYSPEFATGWVTAQYQGFFGRAPDPAGLANWTQQLTSRAMTYGDVLFALADAAAKEKAAAGAPASQPAAAAAPDPAPASAPAPAAAPAAIGCNEPHYQNVGVGYCVPSCGQAVVDFGRPAGSGRLLAPGQACWATVGLTHCLDSAEKYTSGAGCCCAP
jgi:hypothetical protein